MLGWLSRCVDNTTYGVTAVSGTTGKIGFQSLQCDYDTSKTNRLILVE